MFFTKQNACRVCLYLCVFTWVSKALFCSYRIGSSALMRWRANKRTITATASAILWDWLLWDRFLLRKRRTRASASIIGEDKNEKSNTQLEWSIVRDRPPVAIDWAYATCGRCLHNLCRHAMYAICSIDCLLDMPCCVFCKLPPTMSSCCQWRSVIDKHIDGMFDFVHILHNM